MPPDDDEVAAVTTSGGMTGSAIPPAKDVVAARDSAAASAIFFMMYSNQKRDILFSEEKARENSILTVDLTSESAGKQQFQAQRQGTPRQNQSVLKGGVGEGLTDPAAFA